MKHFPKIVLALCVAALCAFVFVTAGCASAPAVNNAIGPARDMIEEWNAARADGKLTKAEIEQHDVSVRAVGRSMDQLAQAVAKSYPPVDAPTDPARWYEWAAGALGLGMAATGTYMKAKKDINAERDAQRDLLGEETVEPVKRVAAARVRAKSPLTNVKVRVGEHPTT